MKRPIFWLSECGSDNGFRNSCAFTTKDEAIKWAIFGARGSVDWSTFPDPAKLYPYDDRDGTWFVELTPIFRVTWPGGWAQVTKTLVDDKCRVADYAQIEVEGIFAILKARPISRGGRE